MKNLISYILVFIISFSAFASGKTDNPLDLLCKNFSQSDLNSSLLKNAEWVPYPSYSDREGWKKLTEPVYSNIIEKGEQALTYQWQVVKATDYLAYERDGSRVIMEKPMNENATALSNLFFAELAEGKGRFLDQIINGVWYFTEMSTWSLSAHVPAYQPSKRTLAQAGVHVVDLMAGDMGSLLSWIHYFLKEDMDKVNPEISSRLKSNIYSRIVEPYMNRNDMWWQALELKENKMVNNWNPWCNFNVLTCLLLIEDNENLKVEGIYKTMRSVDKFINYVKIDGACEEGPSYWGHAAGKLYDYLELLSLSTGNKVNLFDQKVIKDMGEYISQSYIGGDSWVVNFADASAKGGGDPLLIYRYGESVGSLEMKQFAKYLLENRPNKISITRDAFRSLENLRTVESIQNETAKLPNNPNKWYPETEFLYIRNKDIFFAAKGGFNNESHNHNDIGTFILYKDKQPMFIDAGVGTYNKKTFSKERYDIWTMQSDYHNLPQINGYEQPFGAKYKSKNASFDGKTNEFKLDIAGAYPEEANINSWVRKYKINNNELIITDEFDISNPKKENIIHFLLASEPKIEDGIVILNNGNSSLKFDPKLFEATQETIEQDDPRLSNVWGPRIYRLSLKAKKLNSKGSYKFIIN
ncbi:heparinase II/III domain-containing protein [Sphingobacterium daejeonense]|uniref:heparinase II/III domain-containing protein n=1 Tax=Sphingobacterium daejeonense TaxID=371142 RepID=UPI0010C57F75|nr:heparinase II/III family protein [Sphingobacterium daejeonense]VTQ06391.1 Heparinase II/III-like protein [Sphingobacterium daejeonense]